MIIDWKIALPLHPEYRTMPMVWYIPPLSPIMNMVEGKGSNWQAEEIFPAIDNMRYSNSIFSESTHCRR